ncbi:RNA 2'-phosphotransferase [Agromyces sp. G08B096]|uniref:RNA 2'-phosphotransferase n=1 Tax=Agromyces sp. G08B096 TaxID=3156399 RepID=A0AAU7W592_9MICO
MLDAFVRYLERSPASLLALSIRGMRFPFGLRTPSEMPTIFFSAADSLVEALQPSANRGQYSYRDFLSELLAYLARNDPSRTDRAELLTEAIRLRGPVGAKRALAGMRSQLAQAADYILLAKISGDTKHRRTALELLLEVHGRVPNSPDPLVLLAEELRVGGGLQRPRGNIEPQLRSAVSNGDHDAVLRLSAKLVLQTPHMRRRELGGRGGVATADDYLGVSGQAFIFKQMTRVCHERDLQRGAALSAELAREGLTGKFGVVDHLLTVELEDGPIEEVLSIRRFVSGRTLREVLDDREGQAAASAAGHLRSAVDFLAFTHTRTDGFRERGTWRRSVKTRELGRWLKAVVTDHAAAFDAWVSLVADVPLLPRRDAHAQNWLVAADGRILAVDLDAIGRRPATYELAQLIDDAPVLRPDDWDTRESLLRAYLGQLRRAGIEISWDVALRVYEASTAARAVGLLSDPEGANESRLHGFALLEYLMLNSRSAEVAAWCSSVADGWRVRVGLSDPSRFHAISPADRVRISKAMAYHLRHDPTAATSRGGWMFADDLAELLRASGHKVTPQQLLVIAGAMGEPRFELDELEIRAAYGHSVDRGVVYEPAQPISVLYHAAPASALPSIFEARAGLLPMARRMVHLSDDVAVARQAGERHGEEVVLLRVDTEGMGSDLVRAAQRTWLTERVAVESIVVMTILEEWVLRLED